MAIGAFLAFFAPLSAISATLKLADLQSSAKNAEGSAKNAKGFRVISAVIEPHSRQLLYNSKLCHEQPGCLRTPIGVTLI